MHSVASARVDTWRCKLFMDKSVSIPNLYNPIILHTMQGLIVGACFALSSFLCRGSTVLDDLTNSDVALFLSTGKAIFMASLHTNF